MRQLIRGSALWFPQNKCGINARLQKRFKISGDMAIDEEFVFLLSVALLCFLLLHWILIVFLFIWLRKIHQRADQAYKDWNVYSKVNLDVKQTDFDNAYSTPLVITNKRAENSETNESPIWKNIDRTFAYAEADLEEEAENRSAEEREGKILSDSQNVQTEEKIPIDVEDAASPSSDAKINNDGPAMLSLAGGYLDDSVSRKIVFNTRKGTQSCEGVVTGKSLPGHKERLVLVEAGHFIHVNGNGPFPKKTGHSHVNGESNGAEGRTENVVSKDNNRKRTDGIIAGNTTLSEDKQEHRAGLSGMLGNRRKARYEHEVQNLVYSESKPDGKGKKRPKKLSKRKPKEVRGARGIHVTPPEKLNEGGRGVLPVQYKREKQIQDDGDRTRVTVAGSQSVTNAKSQCGVQLTQSNLDEGSYECMETTDSKTHLWRNLSDEGAGFQDTSEEFYANIDDNIAGFREKPASVNPQTNYVNFKPDSECMSEEYLEDSLVYSNTDEVQQDSAMHYDNPVFDTVEEGPMYVNIKEMFDI